MPRERPWARSVASRPKRDRRPTAGAGVAGQSPVQVVKRHDDVRLQLAVSKCLAAGYKMSVTISCLNQRLIMRLLPMKEPDKAWRSVKAQWKKDAEGVGEDFSTFASGSYAAFDSLIKDNSNPSLYCLSDGERVHAVCQVSRLMMSKYSTPMLRARFVSVSPVYELGLAGAGEYAQIMVALFSGIVWLPRCRRAISGSSSRVLAIPNSSPRCRSRRRCRRFRRSRSTGP